MANVRKLFTNPLEFAKGFASKNVFGLALFAGTAPAIFNASFLMKKHSIFPVCSLRLQPPLATGELPESLRPCRSAGRLGHDLLRGCEHDHVSDLETGRVLRLATETSLPIAHDPALLRLDLFDFVRHLPESGDLRFCVQK